MATRVLAAFVALMLVAPAGLSPEPRVHLARDVRVHCRREHGHRVCRARRRRRRRRVVAVAAGARTTTTIIPPPPGPSWPWPQPAGNYPVPVMFDPSGYYSLNCGTDFSVGATINLCHNGQVAGVYLDDTTPNLPAWVRTADAKYSLVVVGQAYGGPCDATGQAFCALEFYPYDCRYPPGQWGPIPPATAYIIQWGFAWPGCGPPTSAERAALLAQVQALHPRLILAY